MRLQPMDDTSIALAPKSLSLIWQDTVAAGFMMASDHQTGSLLRALAASRPLGRLLELGTGTGLSAAWILDGMDPDSTLDSVDNDAAVSEIARRHLGHDPRLRLHVQDGATFLANAGTDWYDFVFADAWPGKYSDLDLAIASLKVGGLYIIDDMVPQANWPAEHCEIAGALCRTLESRTDLHLAKLNWSTGLLLASRIA